MLISEKIIDRLLNKNISISVAESCTGGLLSANIISMPGVSKIYNMGLITYSNKAKSNLLKINPYHLKKYGAVSSKVALLMVKNLKQISNSKLCISTTGIAGPSSSTKTKPIGLIYIGINFKNKIIIIEKKFKGTRKQIQQKTVRAIFYALEKLI